MKRQWESQSWRSKQSSTRSGLLRSNERWRDPSLDSVAPSKQLCVPKCCIRVSKHTLQYNLCWQQIYRYTDQKRPSRAGMRSSPVRRQQSLAASPVTHTSHQWKSVTQIITKCTSSPVSLNFTTPPCPQSCKLQPYCWIKLQKLNYSLKLCPWRKTVHKRDTQFPQDRNWTQTFCYNITMI